MSKFNFLVNWSKFIQDYIPPYRRYNRLIKWMEAMLSQIRSLNIEFSNFATEIRYNMQFDGTVISLETLLNEVFGTTGIYITQAQTVSKKIYLFTEPEDKPLILYTEAEYDADPSLPRVYLHTEAEYLSGTGFIVHVPSSLEFDENRMRALIDKYRAAGKTYTIVKY